MIDISRIDHIASVVPEPGPQLALFEGLLGFRRVQEWGDSGDGPRGVMLEIPGRSGVRWEVLAPADDGDSLQEFLHGPRGPGVHHVQFAVPTPSAAAEQVSALDIQPWHERDGSDAVSIHPERGGQGLLFRLAAAAAAGPCAHDGQQVIELSSAGDQGSAMPSLGVVGIDHVCHACPDRDELGRWYERAFGMRETHRTPPGEHEDLADLVMDVPGGQMRWEVLQPVGEGSFVERFLDSRGSSVHHVAFEVADWERAIAACEHHDVPYFDENSGETDGAKWRDAFIHPRHTGGLLLQFFWEERPDAWVASDKVESGR